MVSYRYNSILLCRKISFLRMWGKELVPQNEKKKGCNVLRREGRRKMQQCWKTGIQSYVVIVREKSAYAVSLCLTRTYPSSTSTRVCQSAPDWGRWTRSNHCWPYGRSNPSASPLSLLRISSRKQNSYFRRQGIPQPESKKITSCSHPTLAVVPSMHAFTCLRNWLRKTAPSPSITEQQPTSNRV